MLQSRHELFSVLLDGVDVDAGLKVEQRRKTRTTKGGAQNRRKIKRHGERMRAKQETRRKPKQGA